MEEPIVLRLGEGERVGANVVKAARPELSLIERELVALHEQGIEPDDAFFERHDVFDA
jgi:hypothetical protein